MFQTQQRVMEFKKRREEKGRSGPSPCKHHEETGGEEKEEAGRSSQAGKRKTRTW